MTKEIIEDLAKAIELGQQMAEVLKKSQMSLFGEAHHVGYERTNASGTVSHIQAKGSTIVKRPEHVGEASKEAEDYSKTAWISDDTKDGHDAAEAALTHSANLHEKAAEEAANFGDSRTSKWHERKSDLHRQMAEEHGAESHRQWQNEQQAKQVAAANEKLAAEKKPMTEAEAGTHLSKIAQKHDRGMHRKAEDWGTAHYHENQHIPAKDVEGTEAREYSHEEVYGKYHRQFKNNEGKMESSPTSTDFSDSFMEKQLEANHDPFVLKHPNGNRYLVDSQGAGYARYIGKIKEEPKEAEPVTVETANRTGHKIPKPPTPQTGIPTSRVTVEHMEHLMAHGHDPKGKGTWMFSKHRKIDFGKHKAGEDYIQTPHLPYAAAKKQAKEWAASKGHSLIWTMP